MQSADALTGPMAHAAVQKESGGAEGDRTLDLRDANATLSQLSYRPMNSAGILTSVTLVATDIPTANLYNNER